MPSPILLAGLGNPGDEYRATYHNVGAAFVEHFGEVLADRRGEPLDWKSRKGFRYARVAPLGAGGAILVLPETFMNVSGAAVAAALRFFSLPPSALHLAHDESDLVLGTMKVQEDRGAAGHHGVESVVAALGTNNFTRIRIGIRPGKATPRGFKAGDHVLKAVSRADREVLLGVYEALARKLIEKV